MKYCQQASYGNTHCRCLMVEECATKFHVCMINHNHHSTRYNRNISYDPELITSLQANTMNCRLLHLLEFRNLWLVINTATSLTAWLEIGLFCHCPFLSLVSLIAGLLIAGLDWTGSLKFLFVLRGMQLKSNHFRVWLTSASVALIGCVRAEELVMQDMLPLGCWVLTDNQLSSKEGIDCSKSSLRL